MPLSAEAQIAIAFGLGSVAGGILKMLWTGFSVPQTGGVVEDLEAQKIAMLGGKEFPGSENWNETELFFIKKPDMVFLYQNTLNE